MNCYFCNRKEKPVFQCKSDKYQKLIGIENAKRIWFQCRHCTLYQQKNFMSPNQIENIYKKFRDLMIRNNNVKNEFKRIRKIKLSESENEYRVRWLVKNLDLETKIIDIGSGLGLFPFRLKEIFPKASIHCLEPNLESAEFIDKELGLSCQTSTSLSGLQSQIVTCVHLLEHIADPNSFLSDIKKVLLPDGKLFIEVPDAVEFAYLPKDHDEFGSIHLFFYNAATLIRILENNGFHITDLHRCYYKKRKLSRLLVTASKSENTGLAPS